MIPRHCDKFDKTKLFNTSTSTQNLKIHTHTHACSHITQRLAQSGHQINIRKFKRNNNIGRAVCSAPMGTQKDQRKITGSGRGEPAEGHRVKDVSGEFASVTENNKNKNRHRVADRNTLNTKSAGMLTVSAGILSVQWIRRGGNYLDGKQYFVAACCFQFQWLCCEGTSFTLCVLLCVTGKSGGSDKRRHNTETKKKTLLLRPN
jgi:hypothetical protein